MFFRLTLPASNRPFIVDKRPILSFKYTVAAARSSVRAAVGAPLAPLTTSSLDLIQG